MSPSLGIFSYRLVRAGIATHHHGGLSVKVFFLSDVSLCSMIGLVLTQATVLSILYHSDI